MTFPTSAVVMACDANFLPPTLHLAWQIACASPVRQFDILIVSENALELPAWAEAAGIRTYRIARQDWADQMPQGHTGRILPSIAYLRLALADALGDRYRRILYLDGDIFFEGGDIGRLLALPLGDHPIAAARDFEMLLVPNYHAREFKAMGLSARPYFNSGVLLIDTDAWRRAKLLERCIAFPQSHRDACFLHDQSVLNGVLQGSFAELPPGWNWQVTALMPFASFGHAVHFRHFIGRTKPWSDTRHMYEERFARSYTEFFRAFLPQASGLAASRPANYLIGLQRFINQAVAQTRRRPPFEAQLKRFADSWDVKV
jgi:lipopolysaccharide biosynthesis glycosyltransferase